MSDSDRHCLFFEMCRRWGKSPPPSLLGLRVWDPTSKRTDHGQERDPHSRLRMPTEWVSFAAEPARQFRLQFRDFQTHARILNRLIDGAAAASRPESLSLARSGGPTGGNLGRTRRRRFTFDCRVGRRCAWTEQSLFWSPHSRRCGEYV